jgi:hypothetical protein
MILEKVKALSSLLLIRRHDYADATGEEVVDVGLVVGWSHAGQDHFRSR